MAPTPVHAATVVLLRDRNGGDIELFMVKRHSKSSFMANAYVYPGGKLDASDTSEATAALCTGLSGQEALRAMAPTGARLSDDAPMTEAEALGIHVAAIREMFEESGALLAHTSTGDLVDFSDPQIEKRFAEHRLKLNSGDLSMTEMAEQEGLHYPLDTLRYFAHWITPTAERRRFNTRFFLAEAPKGQQPLHDSSEVVASAWWSPAEALERYGKGEIQLAPPTLRTLEDMSAYTTVAALMEGMSKEPVPTIMPKLESIDDTMVLLLPGDSLYPSDTPVQGPTRVTLDKGRWWSRKG